MRIRLEGVPRRYHEDHISAKGMNSLSRYNLVHKFILVPQAMKIPEEKAAVDKEWEKLEKIPAWQLTKVRNKNDVTAEKKEQRPYLSFCVFNRSLSSQEFGVGTTISKIQRSSRTPR